MPEKPINAIEISPAVISAIGMPLKDLGGSENIIRVLTPANISIAIVKPTPDAKPNSTE